MFLGTAARVATDDVACHGVLPTPEMLRASVSTARTDRQTLDSQEIEIVRN